MTPAASTRYSIHGFCTFDILDQSGGLAKVLVDVQSRYQCFRVDHDPATVPDMRVVIGGFEPDMAGCTKLDDAWWVKEGYLYHRGETYKMGARWSFDVSGLDGDMLELRISANAQGRPFIAGRIISFLYFLSFAIAGVQSVACIDGCAERGCFPVCGARRWRQNHACSGGGF